MRIKNWDAWRKSIEANQDADANELLAGYGESVTLFASLWLTLMEKAILFEYKTVAGCAEAAEKEANALLGQWGMTGFQYGCAVSLLAETWSYGEDLRRWHNLQTQVGTEGERANESGGVLNPALLQLDG